MNTTKKYCSNPICSSRVYTQHDRCGVCRRNAPNQCAHVSDDGVRCTIYCRGKECKEHSPYIARYRCDYVKADGTICGDSCVNPQCWKHTATYKANNAARTRNAYSLKKLEQNALKYASVCTESATTTA